jgi:1,4-dihydroxy-2-naphthoate octaprenyltransferase
MNRVKPWLMACRPKTLPAAVAPVLMGLALGYSDGAFDAAVAAVTLVTALLLQVGTNYANDYFDFVHGTDTAERQGPTRITQAGLVSLEQMRLATVIVFLGAALGGLFLVYRGGWPILVLGLLAIASAVFYTAGPVPLGYVGLGDLLVLVFFGFVAVGGTYTLQTGTIKATALLAGLAPGMLSTAILAVNNLRDHATDAETGKRTLAVRFGVRFARMEYLFALLVAAAVPVILCVVTRAHYASLPAIATLLFALPALRSVLCGKAGPALNHVLAVTGRVLFLYSVVFAIGWIL